MNGTVDEHSNLVLVADDDPTIRLMAKQALEVGGFTVLTVENGEEALSVFRSREPGIVLLDVSMPKLDGYETCRELRKSSVGQRTPVLMVTGLDDLDSIYRAYDVGATDFVAKPVNWVILRERVRYMIRAREAFEARLSTEAKNQALLNAIPDLIFRINREGVFLDFKPANDIETLFPPEEFIGRQVSEILPEEVAQKCLENVAVALKTGQTQGFEYPLKLNGRTGEYEARTVSCGPDDTLTIVRDVTERNGTVRALKWERDFVSAVLDTASALVLVRDREGRIIQFNRACEQTTGYRCDEVQMRTAWELFLDPVGTEVDRSVFEGLVSGGQAEGYESHWMDRAGNRRRISWSNSVLCAEDGTVEHVISTGIDVTEQKQAEERIRFLAYFDPLTGLPNRTKFKEQLQEAILGAQGQSRNMAVIFIDLDRFKQINDTFGHSTGDLLLKRVAQRLAQSVRGKDSSSRAGGSIGRFGGDEFTVLLEDIDSSQSVIRVTQRLLDALSAPFTVGEQEVFVTASFGISVYPDHGADADTLLKNADIAMYHAKDLRANSYGFYSKSMLDSSAEKLDMENALHRAIEQKDFLLYYQPKVDSRSGRFIGVEALLRWNHPTRGVIGPSSFIRLAEETGLILPIGEWVLEAACRQSIAWQREGLPPVRIAINLSGLQLRQSGFLPSVFRVIESTGLQPDLLELEITEGTIMQNEVEAREKLQTLKSSGIRLSIDDFGTGYSSLSYLKRFPVDSLKIDRSFVRDLAVDPDDRAITAAIIAMAHSLGLNVVGEGVETEQQLNFLKNHGCDEIQGFYFSRAVSAAKLASLLRKNLASAESVTSEARFDPSKFAAGCYSIG